MQETHPPGGVDPPPELSARDRIINRVVVALADGRRARGFIYDLNVDDDTFHLFASEDPSEARAEILNLPECKAIFFVRSLTGNPAYKENKTDLPERKRFGRPFAVTFADGEKMVGTVEIFHPGRKGFYLIPPDPRSNNLRIFVVMANAAEVRPLGVEKEGAGAATWEVPDPVTYPDHKRIEVIERLLRGRALDVLSLEVFLPARVIDHWRTAFAEAGTEALADGALRVPLPSAAPPEEGPPQRRERPDRLAPAERAALVLRLLEKQDPSALSQESLVPVRRLEEWRERYVEAGRTAVRGQAERESVEGADRVRARYEALPEPGSAPGSREIDEFLDGLSLSL